MPPVAHGLLQAKTISIEELPISPCASRSAAVAIRSMQHSQRRSSSVRDVEPAQAPLAQASSRHVPPREKAPLLRFLAIGMTVSQLATLKRKPEHPPHIDFQDRFAFAGLRVSCSKRLANHIPSLNAEVLGGGQQMCVIRIDDAKACLSRSR